jgi:HD superfamily phosphohydrolase YqeK
MSDDLVLTVDAAFDMSREPPELTVGQLADDLAEVSSATEAECAALWHDLAHLVGLVREIEKLAQP